MPSRGTRHILQTIQVSAEQYLIPRRARFDIIPRKTNHHACTAPFTNVQELSSSQSSQFTTPPSSSPTHRPQPHLLLPTEKDR